MAPRPAFSHRLSFRMARISLFCNNDIKITSEEEENLLATGWLIFAGIGWGTATEEGGNLYRYTRTAKQFCNIIFHSDIAISEEQIPVSGALKFE